MCIQSYVDSSWRVAGKGPYKGIIGHIIFDIDGDKNGKNVAGKDVFLFHIDKTGVLVPFGSNASKYLGVKGLYNAENATCSIGSSTSDGITLITSNFACTGKIADNGWKADY